MEVIAECILSSSFIYIAGGVLDVIMYACCVVLIISSVFVVVIIHKS